MSDSEVLFKNLPINQSLSDYLGRFDRISKFLLFMMICCVSQAINVYDKQEKIPYGLGFIIMNLKE
jgi:hypothetical protein